MYVYVLRNTIHIVVLKLPRLCTRRITEHHYSDNKSLILFDIDRVVLKWNNNLYDGINTRLVLGD